MGNGFFLYRGVNDDALEINRFDGLDFYRSLNRGLEQLLQAFFTDGTAKAPDLGCVTWQAWLVIFLAAEVLPNHVFAPANNEFLVTEVVAVLEIQQTGHQAQG